MSHTITVEIEAEAKQKAENMYHEIAKQVDEAHNYGVEIEIRRVETERDHEAEFE